MPEVVEAVFDGSVLRPEPQLAIELNAHVLITVEPVQPSPRSRMSFLQTARSLHLKGPAD
jgi:hypothetical protein